MTASMYQPEHSDQQFYAEHSHYCTQQEMVCEEQGRYREAQAWREASERMTGRAMNG